MSLYRKHRPQQFSDVVGQDHIKTTLANALKQGTFSHAYIFAGPKGSGKTTTARLLAKALNCTGRSIVDSIEPCEKCQSCTEITAGNSMDVMEIDAASNRGIDEIRDLREKINFAPTAGKYKIYVIDECHMLTKEAFNALLKTLEEPPKHVVFVLATTELHKIPATILSRAQLFDFKKAKVDEVLSLLESVAKKEKIEIEKEALQLLARLAYGAYRDALTLLDQIGSIQTEGKITLVQVQAVLGQATEQSVWDLVEALSKGDRTQSLKVINDVYFEGKDLANFTSGVIDLLRKVILIQVGLPQHFEASTEEGTKIKQFASDFDSDKIMILVQKLAEVLPQLKSSFLGQLPLEMVVFETTNSQETRYKIQDANNDKFPISNFKSNSKAKNSNVQKETEETTSVVNHEAKVDVVSEPEVVADVAIIEEVIVSEVKVAQMIDGAVSECWPELIKAMKKENNVVAAMLKESKIHSEEDSTLTLGVANAFQAKQLCNVTIRPLIEKAILELTGKTMKLECTVDTNLKAEKPPEHEEVLLNDVKDIFA